ncbi:hypothetical protein L227DRAFT_205413 [Lentinus tigrinus ALCF2SS1-6]|uniref:Uncharacterized protein n=1 Tax=Lentinus tigrinus ALCF2SS1-6 TaxID=1328759 RepID=A0A5C2SPF7_9APHY|nr:hypothetical protein L227DRAFT_205413 [Lentinus tigrinus ALCF2SS1-6]
MMASGSRTVRRLLPFRFTYIAYSTPTICPRGVSSARLLVRPPFAPSAIAGSKAAIRTSLGIPVRSPTRCSGRSEKAPPGRPLAIDEREGRKIAVDDLGWPLSSPRVDCHLALSTIPTLLARGGPRPLPNPKLAADAPAPSPLTELGR